MGRPWLPLSEVRSGEAGSDFEDLRWYFTEGIAAQSGLKSSQSCFENKMMSGIGQPHARHELDGRLILSISRARGIERRLARVGPANLSVLVEFFSRILPVIDKLMFTKEGKRLQAKLRRDYESKVSNALRAYSGKS